MTKQRKRSRGNGEGSVVKLGGKRKRPFAARVTVGFNNEGKQLFKYVGYYETKTKAKEELNKFLVNPYDLDSSKLTTQDIFDKWSESAKVSKEVISAYYGVLKNNNLLTKVFKDIKLMQLEDIAKQLSPSMQKRFKNALKNLYIYSMKHDILDKNLAELMELDKYKAKEKEAISPADVKAILKGDDVIPIILLYTGMRIGELLDIKSKNVDLEKRIMIGGLKTDAGKNRKIPIHKNLVPILEKLLEEGNTYLISNKGRKVIYSNYLNVWKENSVLKKYSPHYTRHTFISRAVKLELNREVMKAAIGHASTEVTDIYTHIDNDQLLDFIDLFGY